MTYDRRASRPIIALSDFPDFPGLVVRTRRPSVQARIALMQAGPVMAALHQSPRWYQGYRLALAAMMESVVSWTLVADGAPVPPTLTGLLREDEEFASALLTAWLRLVVDAPPPPEPTPRPDFDPSSLIMHPLSDTDETAGVLVDA